MAPPFLHTQMYVTYTRVRYHAPRAFHWRGKRGPMTLVAVDIAVQSCCCVREHHEARDREWDYSGTLPGSVARKDSP